MSSILDALKKVEAEKRKQKVDLGEVEEIIAEQELLVPEEVGRPRRERRANRAVVVAIVVVVVGVFGAVGFLLHGRLTGAGRTDAAGIRSLQPGPPRPDVPPTGAARVGIPSREIVPEPIALPSAAPVETEEPLVQPDVESPTTEPESAALDTDAPELAPRPVEPAPEPSTPEPAGPRPELRINILRAASAEYPEPLAIVNGKKVTVGDSVEGATVLKIQEDGIVFEYGDDVFLVPF